MSRDISTSYEMYFCLGMQKRPAGQGQSAHSLFICLSILEPPFLYAGWPPPIQECFIRVLTVRRVDQCVLIPFLVHDAGECFSPRISSFIHVLDEEIIVVVLCEPLYDFRGGRGPICVNAGYIRVQPTLVEK